MNDTDIQQRFQLMQRELESTVSLLKKTKLDLTAAVDSLKLELEVVKIFLERHHPDFSILIRSSGKKRCRRSTPNGPDLPR